MVRKGTVLNLTIEKLAFGGLGIAYYKGLVIFVKGSIPGQKVSAKIYKKKKNYLEAYIVEVIDPSIDEVEKNCNHFGVCGGCSFQNYNYNSQLNQKYNQVNELFEKMLKKKMEYTINPIIGCGEQFHYRNKMEFTYSYNKWIVDLDSEIDNNPALGLHVKARFDKIVDIDNCSIQGSKSNIIFSFIKSKLTELKISAFNMKSKQGYLRNIIIREAQKSNQVLVNFITTNNKNSQLKKLSNALVKEFDFVKGVINTIVKPNSGSSIGDEEIILFGESYIEEMIGEYIFKISKDSFFQTNSKQAEVLYEQIKLLSDLDGNEIVYDLYCGTGSIGIYLSKFVKKIYGIEVVMSAVLDGIENTNKNEIKNVNFFHGDLTNFFEENKEIPFIEKPDLLIVDPPRAGMHTNTLTHISTLNAKKIIYVSCNPSTQVRDVNFLIENGYCIKNIQPVDMFPHTPHIENIVSLYLPE